MISHYQMKAILRSESNFSFSYNFFLVRPKNQFREVKYQKSNEKKRSWKRIIKKICNDNEL